MFSNLNTEKDTDRVVIFIHIAKSGGNTVHDIMTKQKEFQSDTWIRLFSELDNFFGCLDDCTTEEQRKRIEVAYGHMFFGVHKKLPQKNFTYITFLRNPIERIISCYYFNREVIFDMNLRNMFNNMTLYDFVTNKDWDLNYDGFWSGSTANMQTRMLAGTIEDDLETAKNNLKNYFSVVGITERFDETLKVLHKNLGWEINGYENRNVNPNRHTLDEIPNEVIEIIKSKNEKDIALYQFANQLLDEQIKNIKANNP